MAERAGFSVAEIDDVRLAVDELCAILIAAGGDCMTLRMQAREERWSSTADPSTRAS